MNPRNAILLLRPLVTEVSVDISVADRGVESISSVDRKTDVVLRRFSQDWGVANHTVIFVKSWQENHTTVCTAAKLGLVMCQDPTKPCMVESVLSLLPWQLGLPVSLGAADNSVILSHVKRCKSPNISSIEAAYHRKVGIQLVSLPHVSLPSITLSVVPYSTITAKLNKSAICNHKKHYYI